MTKTLTYLIFAILLLVGCAVAPVQEMSDARQAIQAAQHAGASDWRSPQLVRAKELLSQAQGSLEAHDYDQARALALDARDKAIRAREQIDSGSPAQ